MKNIAAVALGKLRTHCKECGGKGWNYPGTWAVGLLKPHNAVRQITCAACKGSGKRDMAAVGSLGGLAARGKPRKRQPAPRCACGKMTLARAEKRNHKCKGESV